MVNNTHAYLLVFFPTILAFNFSLPLHLNCRNWSPNFSQIKLLTLMMSGYCLNFLLHGA